METKATEKKEFIPGEELIKSWNKVIRALVALEIAWKEHRAAYARYRNEIQFMHPLVQRKLNRVINKQPFHYFLDDVSRDARTGVKKLFIKQ